MKCAPGSLGAAVVAAMILLPPIAAVSAGEHEGLTARIELWGRYYRAGEPVKVRILLENPTDKTIANPEGLPLLSNLELSRDEGEAKKATSPPAFDPSTQPRLLSPGGGFLMVVDLAELFPELATAGNYTLRLRAGAIESAPVELMVVHPFNPDLDYSATLKTDFGDITFDLLEAVAPDHVRNFVDLAKQGFYDGTLFHIIAKGEVVMGGDTAGEASRGVSYFLTPEISSLPHERGTLCSVRTGGPDNGAQFFIDLRRKPEFDGNFTVFGQITAGEEALKALENVATTGNNFQPFFKPLEDVVLHDVIISEKPKEETPEGEEQGGKARGKGDLEGSY